MSIEVKTPRRTLTAILSLAVVYFFAGKFGLSLATEHPSASAIWPPSGIALAALLLCGYRLWPGIFIGAFLVNITTEGNLATTLGIASGNTLEAFVGAWLIDRFANGRKVFERAKNIFKFILLAALMSTALGATVGVSSLALGGYAPWDRYAAIWFTWWLGDMAGDLLVAPLLVIWLTAPYPHLTPGKILEAAGVLLSIVISGYIVFLSGAPLGLEYVLMLPLLWAAFRFGRRGSITAAFFISAIALAGTIQGHGPFAAAGPDEALLDLQGFTTALAMVALVLAGAISERMRAEQRVEIQEAVSRILAESPDLAEAGPKILRVLCERAHWSAGAIWRVDRTADELACVEFWQLASAPAPLFEAESRKRKFPSGVGLPGRVLSAREATWIPDVTKDNNFPRAAIAAREGLHAAFGFPIKRGHEVVGVVECFSQEVREIDDDFLRIVDDIGNQLGQFVERTRAEEALRQSEEELADFFDTAAESLHWVGPDGTILRANPAELNMLGYTEPEYVGRNIAEFHADAEVIEDILERLTRGEILDDFPARMRCKDGSLRHVLINSSVYRKNGVFVHTRCFTRDVTRLQHAEEARAMLAAIVESSSDAIISKNLDGTITSWNGGAERLFGYRGEEMIGQSVLRLIPPQRHEEETANLARLRRGERIDHYETVRAARDGRLIDVSLTVSPIRNSEGIIIGASKIARDITERKHAEKLLGQAKDDLLEANEQLEKRVQERTADLEQAHAALLKKIEEQKALEEQLRQAQKMESIGTLAGGIAHDFNNTLNIIKAYAQLLGASPPTSRQIIESTKIINEEVERGAAVVRQLLTLARKTETRLARTDANRIVLTVSELIKQAFPKAIEIRLDLDPALLPVLADANQINQALLNICVNARDAMPQGGVITLATKMIGADALPQRQAEFSPNPYVCIAVTDTGTGMDETVRSRAFEPFFTTKEFGEGTGLGLAMVYGIVKNHHGVVDLESAPGRGATIRLLLPAFEADDRVVAGEKNEKIPAACGPAKESIVLIVEDEERMVQLLKSALLKKGYGVLVAMDGAEAIELYQRRGDEIDLVLMDLGLPKVNGSEVIRVMKKQNPGVHIIVTTGYLEPDLKAELLGVGIKEYIQKPYFVPHVLQRIGEYLQ